MDKIIEVFNYSLEHLSQLTWIFIILIALCAVLYAIMAFFLLYFDNIITKAIGGIIGFIFTAISFITKLLGTFWGILIIIKIIEKFI